MRIAELLDSLCDSMTDYELRPATSSNVSDYTWQWYHSKHQQKRPPKHTKLDKAQQKQQQRQLQNYCGQLFDKDEEALTTALQKGLSTQGDAQHGCNLLF